MIEFLSMGGYGPYVWSAYGIVLVSLVFLGLKARWENKKVKQQIRDTAIE